MTCAGISSLAIAGPRSGLAEGREFCRETTIHDCGRRSGRAFAARHRLAGPPLPGRPEFSERQTVEVLLSLWPRACRPLDGRAVLRRARLVSPGGRGAGARSRTKESGSWGGVLVENDEVLATSFAVLFLAKGRAPVLINKLRHGPRRRLEQRPGRRRQPGRNCLARLEDAGDLADRSTPRRRPLPTCYGRRFSSSTGTKPRSLNRPNGRSCERTSNGGGVIFAEACCGSADFDRGFRMLMKEMFPDQEEELRPLPDDHPIWRVQVRDPAGAIPCWASAAVPGPRSFTLRKTCPATGTSPSALRTTPRSSRPSASARTSSTT